MEISTRQSAPLVLIADDNAPIVKVLSEQVESWGFRAAVALNKSTLLQQFARERPALVVLDLRFGAEDGVAVMRELLLADPDLAVILLTGYGCIDTAVAAIRQGAYDYLTKPPDLQRFRLTIERAIEKRNLTLRIQKLKELVENEGASRLMRGDGAAVDRLRELIASVAPTDATVLILGESGTGKELVARALHEQSRRREGPFVPVNMAALPRELIESTLFGHEKGAFTGADQVRIGCCEAADHGTLFLDEIGEMDLENQTKLLRFLQEREVVRVGATKSRSLDVRIVAATNRDLQERVRAGKFREDLYYRLNVVPVEVPPLRDRREDIPLLATHFLERSALRHGKTVTGFSPEVLSLLAAYDWPGNIRQLENLIERVVILCRGGEVDAKDLPAELRVIRPVAVMSVGSSEPGVMHLDQVERRAILEALQASWGNVRDAARLLGMGQATVYRRIKQYGVHPIDFTRRGVASRDENVPQNENVVEVRPSNSR